MCKYCEKMEPLVSGKYSNGETLEVNLVPIPCGKNFSPAYILVNFDPFRNGIKWYKDIINYDLIYLQHGILHAKLLKMYSKELEHILETN